MSKVRRPKREDEEEDIVASEDVKPFRFRPHPGAQTKYFKTDADIIIAGGGAGGGKTMTLLMDPLQGLRYPGYEAAMFRKTLVMHKMGGGLRNESKKFYPKIRGAKFNGGELQWEFPYECKIKFYGCDDPTKYDGLQCAFLAVDQVEQLTSEEFWHLQSRVRTTSGAPTKIRATCNPEPGWLEVLLKSGGYVDKDGWSVDEMDGVVQWFIKKADSDEVVWKKTREEFGPLGEKGTEEYGIVTEGPYAGLMPSSFTYIRFPLEQNKSLPPAYKAALQRMGIVERRKKLDGNWNQWSGGGAVYKREWWGLNQEDVWVASKNRMPMCPEERIGMAWAWDIGWSTTSDWCVGILFGQGLSTWYILDMIKFRAREHVTFKVMLKCAEITTNRVSIALPRDPGKAGLDQEGWQALLGQAGYQAHLVPDDSKSGDKVQRHRFLSPQAETGHLKIVSDWRPTREVSFWITQQADANGKPLECTTVDGFDRELVESLDALADGCPHVVTDVTDAVARGHRHLTQNDPAGAFRIAEVLTRTNQYNGADDPRLKVAQMVTSQWNTKNRPGTGRVHDDPRDFLFHGRPKRH